MTVNILVNKQINWHRDYWMNKTTFIFTVYSTISSHQAQNMLPTYQMLLRLHPYSHLEEWRRSTLRVICVRISNATTITRQCMISGTSLAASLKILAGQWKWQNCNTIHIKFKTSTEMCNHFTKLAVGTFTHARGTHTHWQQAAPDTLSRQWTFFTTNTRWQDNRHRKKSRK